MLKRLVFLLSATVSFLHAEPDPVPFPFDWTKVHESRIDLSRFLDAPAGKHGPLRTSGETFVTGDDKPIRFWGVNLAIDICFAPKDQAAQIADDLARWGINLVRFHHIDTDWGRSFIDPTKNDTQHFSAENLDRFDFLVAELKKRGIWVQLTLNIHRHFKEGDQVRDHKILSIGKAATYFNPRLIELQHKFTRGFLTHKNPYTGLTYAEEPAIAFIELLNENSLIEAWAGNRLRPGVDKYLDGTWQPIPDSYARELDSLYYDWLLKNGTAEERAAITKETSISFDKRPADLPQDLRLVPADFTKASEARFTAEARFLMDIEANFFDTYKKLIREELGSNALLTLSNDHANGISGYPHLKGNLRGDWVDGHGYWQHPSIGKVTKSNNTPMVNVPLDSTIVQFARSAPLEKPFTIGETNHAFPHRFATEGYPLLTAYAQLQDWDALNWFSWKAGRLAPLNSGIQANGWFDLSNDSMKLAQLATCALMWHRHDISPARKTHLRAYSPEEIPASLRLQNEAPFFKPGFDLTLPLTQKVRFTFDTTQKSSPLAEKSPNRPWEKPALITSDTGQLTWSHADIDKGLVKIDSPKTVGLVGFLRSHWWKPEAATRHLKVEPQSDHCSVILTSLDDQDIATSTRLLLTATCRSANTGQSWRDDLKTLATWGTGPITIVPVRGKAYLSNLSEARSIAVHALTAEGRRTGSPLKITPDDQTWTIPLTADTTWWEIKIDRK